MYIGSLPTIIHELGNTAKGQRLLNNLASIHKDDQIHHIEQRDRHNRASDRIKLMRDHGIHYNDKSIKQTIARPRGTGYGSSQFISTPGTTSLSDRKSFDKPGSPGSHEALAREHDSDAFYHARVANKIKSYMDRQRTRYGDLDKHREDLKSFSPNQGSSAAAKANGHLSTLAGRGQFSTKIKRY